MVAGPNINVTIPAGETLSNSFDASNAVQVFVGMPDDWTDRAPISFRVSPDAGATWYDAVDALGNEIMIAIIPGTAMQLDTLIANKGHVIIRSGSRKYPVVQKADRAFVLNIVTR